MTIRIGMPSNMQASLIFHYNLKFYDNDTDTFENTSLKRFVMQVRITTIYIRCEWEEVVIELFDTVCRWKRGGLPSTRALQRRFPSGYFRKRRDPSRVPDGRAHEIQERLQVQDRLRGPSNSHGATAGLR